MKSLGEKIWRLREAKGLSQDALAEVLGVSRQTISNWENDKAILDAEKLQRLCAVLDVSADSLLNDDEPRPKAAEKPPKKRRLFLPILFAALAVIFIVLAAVGVALFDGGHGEASISLYPSAVWGGLFVLGGVALVVAIVLLFKKR